MASLAVRTPSKQSREHKLEEEAYASKVRQNRGSWGAVACYRLDTGSWMVTSGPLDWHFGDYCTGLRDDSKIS